MNNKNLLLVIALVILSPIILIMLYVSLRIWPLWLLFIIIVLVVVIFKKIEIPGNEFGEVKTGMNNFLQKINILIHSPSYRSFIRKLFLYPFIAILLIGVLSLCLEFIMADYLKARSTRKEMREITEALNQYHHHVKQFPEDLQKLIGNNPLKKEWTSDEWDKKYLYKSSADKQNFTLSSLGKDANPGTEDDIIFEQQGEIKQK